MKIVKILPDSSASKNYCANGVLRLVGINTASDVDGDVLMKSDGYNAVFKTTKKTADNSQKRLSIVKISANGKVIYRAYRGVSATDFLKDYVALTPNSIMLLNDKAGNEPKEVEVSKGCIFPFYWYHPDKAVRISFKLGLVSLLMGVISIVISIIGLM
jgi:hypothetical protein